MGSTQKLFASDFFEAMMAFGQLLEENQDLETILHQMLVIVLRFTHFDRGMLHLTSEENDTLFPAVQICFDGPACVGEPSLELPERVLAGRRPVYVENAFTDPETATDASRMGYATRVCLPLVVIGRPQGVLDLYHVNPRELSSYERYLIEALAVNVTALLGSCRLYSQTQAANAHLMRLSEFGSRILASENTQQAVDLTVRYVLKATQAHSALAYLVDPEGNLLLRYGLDQAGRNLPDITQPRLEGTARHIQLSGQPVVVTGYEHDSGEKIAPPLRRQGIRAFVGLPLRRGDRDPIGVLYVRYAAPHIFSRFEVEGLLLYAAQATGAIEYLRLLEQGRRREVDLSILVDSAHLLISTLDPDELLPQVAVRLCWMTGMSSCAIYSYERQGNYLSLLAETAASGERGDRLAGRSVSLDQYPELQAALLAFEPRLLSSNDPSSQPGIASLSAEKPASGLLLPLQSGGELVGLVELKSQQDNLSFSPEDFKRLRALAEQLALALGNARHYQEEQRAHLTAETLRQATAALNTSLELTQVLDMILEQLQRVVSFDSASLLLLEGDEYKVVAVRGQPGREHHLGWRGSLDKDALLAVSTAQQESLILADVHQGLPASQYLSSPDVRSCMYVPMVSRGEVLGLLLVESSQPDAYTPADAAVPRAFADHAALAVANARHYQLEHEHRTLAEVLVEISLALSSSLKETVMLEVLLEQIGRVVPYDSGCVMMLEGDIALVVRDHGYDRFGITDISNFRLSVENTVNLKQMASTLRPHYISDVQREPAWVAAREARHVRSWVGAPLIASGRLLGFLSLDKVDAGFYRAEHAERLGILAGHAALALQNAIAYGQLVVDSLTDYLTGVFNHRFFQEQIRSEVDWARHRSQPLSMLMIDIDHFKRVNDTYGHVTGDQLLKQIAERLRGELRATDHLARYGGEEFAVILPGSDMETAVAVAERLRAAVAEAPFICGEVEKTITISVGVAAFPEHGDQVSKLIARADQALYRAKRLGRDQVCAA